MYYLSGVGCSVFFWFFPCMKTENIKQCYTHLVIDNVLPSNNPLCFWKNLLEEANRIIMVFHNKIRGDKLQNDFNRALAKKSASSSGKIDK